MFNKIRDIKIKVYETDEDLPENVRALVTRRGPDEYAIIWRAGDPAPEQAANFAHEVAHIWARDLDGGRIADAAEQAINSK